MTSSLTALEREVVALTARENWPGFRLDGLRVRRRVSTGAGRYSYIEDTLNQALPDGWYSAEGRMIEMRGVRLGLGFVIHVSSSRIDYIELFTFGNEAWDGTERGWMVV